MRRGHGVKAEAFSNFNEIGLSRSLDREIPAGEVRTEGGRLGLRMCGGWMAAGWDCACAAVGRRLAGIRGSEETGI